MYHCKISKNDLPFQIYTVRPSRRLQQPQTRLTTRGRIRRPTRPPTTTTASTLTTPSDHRQNEVPDAFTTESVPTTRGTQFALQPEYDTSLQYQPKRQPYQPIERTREPIQHYQPDQYYQTIQRQQGTVLQYEPGKYYQSTPRGSQLPIQQYQPEEQQNQQYLSVERSRVTDQISLPSDNRPQYGFNDPESGAESQWSGRTQTFNSSNAIPDVTKSIATLLEVTTVGSEMTEEAESTTETTLSTTDTATFMLTALPSVSTTTVKSMVSLAVFFSTIQVIRSQKNSTRLSALLFIYCPSFCSLASLYFLSVLRFLLFILFPNLFILLFISHEGNTSDC